jgi:hypothetical protein
MVNEYLMVDIETMGKKPTAPIVSIGAVFFNLHTGVLGKEFYSVVSLKSSMANGAIAEPDTILWWLKQSAEARAAICESDEDDGLEIVDVLNEFFDFFYQ